MKKLLAAALASSMVLSMAATSLAAIEDIGDNKYNTVNDKITLNPNATVPYGETIYYPLLADPSAAAPAGGVVSYDDVKGVTIKQQWDMNGSAVSKLEIVKKKASDDNYYYFLAVNTNNNTTTKSTDVSGKVELKRSGSAPVAQSINLAFTLAYPTAADALEVSDDVQVHKFAGNEEDVISFDGGYFTVNTVGQSDLLMSFNNKFNSTVSANNPTANLDFLTFNGASFNKIGELTIEAAKDSFIYTLNADGSLTKVAASYDEYEEAFKLKTRTLGSYVISDVELKSVAANNGSSKPNPGTGAIA